MMAILLMPVESTAVANANPFEIEGDATACTTKTDEQTKLSSTALTSE
jgi:hypothetical protein